MAAYAYYKAGKLPEAIASAERYTTMHPGTKEAPLAHHIIAQSYFEADEHEPDRDQDGDAQGARPAAGTLKTRYPDSTYAQKADDRDPPVRGHAGGAGDERRPLLHGQEQPRRGHQPVQDGGQRVPDDGARRRGAGPADEGYMALGIAPEAQNAAAVLGHNFPDRSGTRTAYALLQPAGPDASGQPGLVDDQYVLQGPAEFRPAPPGGATEPAPAAPVARSAGARRHAGAAACPSDVPTALEPTWQPVHGLRADADVRQLAG